ncbi:MAG: hypothetical protein IJJ26_01540 [Victivallales bacterium]|nr:hypothetical protein [Victivallales bacterium]
MAESAVQGDAVPSELGEVLPSLSDNLTLALELRMRCLQGDWQNALALRERLLAAADGPCWGLRPGDAEPDLLTTCFAIEALDSFAMAPVSAAADLDVPSMAFHWETSGEQVFFDGLVFNLGQQVVQRFLLRLEAVSSEGTISLWEEEVAWLGEGASLRCRGKAQIPSGTVALRFSADPDGRVDDANRANNVLVFPLTSGEFLATGNLAVWGMASDGTLFSGPGQGTLVQAMVAASQSEVSWCLRDNEVEVASGTCALCEQCACWNWEWFPTEGEHQLVLEWSDGRKTICAVKNVSVCYDAAVLRVHDDSGEGESFEPRTQLTFEARTSLLGCSPVVRIFHNGEWIGDAAPVKGSATHFTWGTGANPPGEYQALAEFRRNGVLCATAEVAFSLTEGSRHFDLKIMRPVGLEVFTGAKTQIPVEISWRYAGNLPDRVEVACRLVSSEGKTLREGMTHALCQPESIYQNLTLEPMEWRFTSAGTYELQVQIADCLARAQIHGKATPTLSIRNEVVPEVIGFEAKPVRTELALMAHRAEDGIPVSFEADGVFVEDVAGAEEILHLMNIRDAGGYLVRGGRLVCTVGYGDLGGEHLGEMWRSGAAVAVEIVDGEADVPYYPVGGLLGEGRFATLPVHVYAFPEDVLGERIGTVEVFLRQGERKDE